MPRSPPTWSSGSHRPPTRPVSTLQMRSRMRSAGGSNETPVNFERFAARSLIVAEHLAGDSREDVFCPVRGGPHEPVDVLDEASRLDRKVGSAADPRFW